MSIRRHDADRAGNARRPARTPVLVPKRARTAWSSWSARSRCPRLRPRRVRRRGRREHPGRSARLRSSGPSGSATCCDILPAALGIFAVGFADGILTARSSRGDTTNTWMPSGTTAGRRNLAAGIVHAFPVGASASRTAVNDQIGGRTQLAGVVCAGVDRAGAAVPDRPVEISPKVSWERSIISAARRARGAGRVARPGPGRKVEGRDRRRHHDGRVIVFGVLEALILAVGLSILDAVTAQRQAPRRRARLGERMVGMRRVRASVSEVVTPGIVVYRLDDRLFFANASYFKGRVREAIAERRPRRSGLSSTGRRDGDRCVGGRSPRTAR